MAATANIKQEILDPNEVESKILSMLNDTNDGISSQMILENMPQCNIKNVVDGLNLLLSKKYPIVISKKSNGELVYKLQATAIAGPKGADHEEKLVYQIIEESGNKGIWNKHIQEKSKIIIKILDKILKNLEAKKLIKKVVSVTASRRRIYMLYDLEPDQSLTGGTWYSDQRFDSEYVDLINQCCLKFLENKREMSSLLKVDILSQRSASYMSSHEILKLVTDSNISKVQLTIKDIESILETLVFDGKVEKRITISDQSNSSASSSNSSLSMYRIINATISSTGLMRIPCGRCPLIMECKEGGIISPSTCVYMDEWLNS